MQVGQPRWHLAGYCDEFSVGHSLNRYGAKFFSQSDEDGITLEIIKRLD
jgi:hypothetical protein